MGYFAQHAMDLLDGERTVFEELDYTFPQAGQGQLRTLAGCFGFSGDDVEKRCRVLSGGEKARLVMAKMLFDPPNFLVLDEPTNHLDMATKEMLIAALARYEGTMLFVSHDRHFLGGAVQPRAGADAGRHPHLWRRLYGICRAHRPGSAGIAELSGRTSFEIRNCPRLGQCMVRTCEPSTARIWRWRRRPAHRGSRRSLARPT